mgnify:CR=1 FL=1
MNNYWRMMEQVTMSDRKKEEIMDMLENQATQKRRMPRAGKLILAAALAVGCVLSIAAGLPAQVYNFVAGGSATINPGTGEGHFVYDSNENNPITVENGRLWFDADGQKVDVTDKMDASTPYIYERTDPKTGNKGYVVLGGTVDDYGWTEFFLTEDGTCSMLGNNAWEYMVPVDGKDISMSELTDAQRDMLNADGGIPMVTVNRPWLDAALAQLDLDAHTVG